MTDFENRDRCSWGDVVETLIKGSARILHVMRNDDDSYSIMSHINCEWCDYCDEANDHPEQCLDMVKDDRIKDWKGEVMNIPIHKPKPDPYEGRNSGENLSSVDESLSDAELDRFERYVDQALRDTTVDGWRSFGSALFEDNEYGKTYQVRMDPWTAKRLFNELRMLKKWHNNRCPICGAKTVTEKPYCAGLDSKHPVSTRTRRACARCGWWKEE